jgi:hypothetical protein
MGDSVSGTMPDTSVFDATLRGNVKVAQSYGLSNERQTIEMPFQRLQKREAGSLSRRVLPSWGQREAVHE